jgi:hypothetical protein
MLQKDIAKLNRTVTGQCQIHLEINLLLQYSMYKRTNIHTFKIKQS